MRLWDGTASEYSGRVVLIVDIVSYNREGPSDFFYVVLLGTEMLYMNHQCFVNGARDWKVLTNMGYAHYL